MSDGLYGSLNTGLGSNDAIGRVVENWDMVMTAPASAFLFTACST